MFQRGAGSTVIRLKRNFFGKVAVRDLHTDALIGVRVLGLKPVQPPKKEGGQPFQTLTVSARIPRRQGGGFITSQRLIFFGPQIEKFKQVLENLQVGDVINAESMNMGRGSLKGYRIEKAQNSRPEQEVMLDESAAGQVYTAPAASAPAPAGDIVEEDETLLAGQDPGDETAGQQPGV